jgi:2-polyprenyl-3-methyl-5-hydroxy-6-metoxy-1,4-benzoquinol methylase
VPGANFIGDYYKSENYISHTNTSKGLINRLYQTIRKTTLRQKRKLVSRIAGVATGNLLDVGSGTGAFANEMIQHGWSVTGLEPDAGARDVARNNFDIDLRDTGELFNLGPNSFDVITMWHVLEHVHDLQKYVAQLK